MSDDLAGRKTGERIKHYRNQRGYSREVVGSLVGKSGSWLKGIEISRRNPPSLEMLLRLAQVLQVSDVVELVGTDVHLPDEGKLPVTSFHRIPHPSVPEIREAIHAPLFTMPDRSMDVQALLDRVAHGWHLWHTSPTQRTDVGRILPALITDARVMALRARNGERRQAQLALASVYALCEQLLAWAAEPELLWLISDRGVAAAHEADEPEALAMSGWVLGNVRRATGDFEGAIELVDDAVELLTPLLEHGSNSLRGVWGALHLHAAITYARAGREGDAWRMWDEGDKTAKRLPNGYNHPTTQFGAANVAVHGVSVGADLTKSYAARSRAQDIDPITIPSLERRSRLMIETARAYAAQDDEVATLHWIQSAYAVSSENVHYSPLARGMLLSIANTGGAMVRREATNLASTLRLPV